MDSRFEAKLLPTEEAEAEIGFDTKGDPILVELLEEACFLDYQKLKGVRIEHQSFLTSLDRQKKTILEHTARQLEQAEFGALYPEDRENNPVTKMIEPEGEGFVVRDLRNKGSQTFITRGMAIEAARWNSFQNVGFELGRHGANTLRKIIRARAIQDISELRNKEMAIIMIDTTPRSLAGSFGSKLRTIGSNIKDKDPGDAAEDIVASWIRILCEDGLLPFSFKQADVIDDVRYHTDYICTVPRENIPPIHRKDDVEFERHAVDFTLRQRVDALATKAFDSQKTISRQEERPSEDVIHKAHVISYNFPHKVDRCVQNYDSWKQGTWRGPEMSLDSTSRQRIMELFLQKICPYLDIHQTAALVRKMQAAYKGMYKS